MRKKWVICSAWLLFFTAVPAHAVNIVDGYLQDIEGAIIKKKELPFFLSPDKYKKRWKDINLYFKHRFGIVDAQSHMFWPKTIILHSTEGGSESSAYNTFAYGSSGRFLGGVWTHFAIDKDGVIYQYSPIDRISKGQAGLNDVGVGIEIIGFSTSPSRPGTIISRYRKGNQKQLKATIALVKSLQEIFDVPSSRVYSHQEVASVKSNRGKGTVDFDWLKSNIRDRVYLGEVPALNVNGLPGRKYGYLQPYGRTDPGIDVMQVVRKELSF